MKKILTLCSLFVLVLALSCGKENTDPIGTASVNLSFKATYDGETLVLNQQTYDYLGKPVRFSKINFYLSDLIVSNNDGDTELTEIQFINLTETHNSIESAENGTRLGFSRVPAGVYNKLKFGIGVPADLNRTTPADYSNSHPLGLDNGGEYWEAWDSYIFAKVEGQYDIDGDGFDGDDISFAYHAGMDNVYQRLELDNQRNLTVGETVNFDFELDIKELLTLPRGDLLELEAHDPNNQIEEMIVIMSNFKTALKLR